MFIFIEMAVDKNITDDCFISKGSAIALWTAQITLHVALNPRPDGTRLLITENYCTITAYKYRKIK